MNTFKFLFFLILLNQQTEAQTITEINLYDHQIPGEKENSVKERVIILANGGKRITSVVNPTLTKFEPANPNGISVIVCPGGGYERLSIDYEGYDVAKEFNKHNITAFVLKYRLPNDSIMKIKAIGPLQDIQQAIRKIRTNATLWQLKPNKIGVIGFSAGGHLASTAATHFNTIIDGKFLSDTTSVKPNFAMLIYPVISFDTSIYHKGSMQKLLGKTPSLDSIIYFSSDKQITKSTPPVFIVHAGDDPTVPVENSILFYKACIKNKVPAEMHLYPKGGHGFGLNNKTTADVWFERLINWISKLQ